MARPVDVSPIGVFAKDLNALRLEVSQLKLQSANAQLRDVAKGEFHDLECHMHRLAARVQSMSSQLLACPSPERREDGYKIEGFRQEIRALQDSDVGLGFVQSRLEEIASRSRNQAPLQLSRRQVVEVRGTVLPTPPPQSRQLSQSSQSSQSSTHSRQLSQSSQSSTHSRQSSQSSQSSTHSRQSSQSSQSSRTTDIENGRQVDPSSKEEEWAALLAHAQGLLQESNGEIRRLARLEEEAIARSEGRDASTPYAMPGLVISKKRCVEEVRDGLQAEVDRLKLRVAQPSPQPEADEQLAATDSRQSSQFSQLSAGLGQLPRTENGRRMDPSMDEESTIALARAERGLRVCNNEIRRCEQFERAIAWSKARSDVDAAIHCVRIPSLETVNNGKREYFENLQDVFQAEVDRLKPGERFVEIVVESPSARPTPQQPAAATHVQENAKGQALMRRGWTAVPQFLKASLQTTAGALKSAAWWGVKTTAGAAAGATAWGVKATAGVAAGALHAAAGSLKTKAGSSNQPRQPVAVEKPVQAEQPKDVPIKAGRLVGIVPTQSPPPPPPPRLANENRAPGEHLQHEEVATTAPAVIIRQSTSNVQQDASHTIREESLLSEGSAVSEGSLYNNTEDSSSGDDSNYGDESIATRSRRAPIIDGSPRIRKSPLGSSRIRKSPLGRPRIRKSPLMKDEKPYDRELL